jgi:crotonobetainyl-CoA:carnitine CoA-transferase CaiB-like acyl-CoA transferase
MKALDGITVLEFASYVSGPYAGMMLSDLGAEVIKIEAPGTGDNSRTMSVLPGMPAPSSKPTTAA